MKSKNNAVIKGLDGWSEVFIIDPISTYIVNLIPRKYNINPLLITFLSFTFGIVSAVLLIQKLNIFAGIAMTLSIILDGMDGKIARQNNNNVYLHRTFDLISDQIVQIVLILSIVYVHPASIKIMLTYLVLLYLFEVSYAMRSDIKQEIVTKKDANKLNDIHNEYNTYLNQFNHVLARIINRLHQITFKFRTFPYPKTTDVRFILNLFIYYPNQILLYLMIIFLIPDFIISFILTIMITFRIQKQNAKDNDIYGK